MADSTPNADLQAQLDQAKERAALARAAARLNARALAILTKRT